MTILLLAKYKVVHLFIVLGTIAQLMLAENMRISKSKTKKRSMELCRKSFWDLVKFRSLYER
jgi:ABC-type uncharacterized transport system ATPase component